ncbi:MAG TPA: hypothetical protein VMC80_00335 [Patescibacteria group bacterium]|nr:hypothetical protein [Patescibacteria group bacterium]
MGRGLRSFSKWAVLTAAILSAIGCTTVGDWEKTSSSWEQTGNQNKIETKKGTETENKRVFDISDLTENYSVNVSNSLWQTNYQINEISNVPELRELENQSRETITRSGDTFLGSGIIFTLIGFLAGDYAGSGFKSFEMNSQEQSVGGIIGGAVGFLSGMFLAYKIGNKDVQTETQQVTTGVTKYGDPVIAGTERVLSDEGWGYQKRPAANTNVVLSLDRFTKRTKTNSEGSVNLGTFMQSMGINYFFPDKVPSEGELEEIVKEFPLSQQIKKSTLDVLMGELVKDIYHNATQLNVATDEKPSQGEGVENASKSFTVDYYGLSSDDIYRAVQGFVERQINSYIKTVTIDVKNRASRVPINGENFDITSDAPSPMELAGKYFTDNLMEFARKQIRDYIYGECLEQNLPARVTLSVYTPSKISYEVTHPDYEYVTDSVSVSGDKKGIVYMEDLGSKIRVETQNPNNNVVTEWAK